MGVNKKILLIIPILVTLVLQYIISNVGSTNWSPLIHPYVITFHVDLGTHARIIQNISSKSFLGYPLLFHFPLSILNLSINNILITLYLINFLLLALNMHLFMGISQSDFASILFAVNPFFPLLLMAGAYTQLVSVSIILYYFKIENNAIKIILLGLLIYGYPLALVVIAPITLIKKEWKVLGSAFLLSIPYLFLATQRIKEVMYSSRWINIYVPPFYFESLIWSYPKVQFLIFVILPLLYVGLSFSVLVKRTNVSTSLISIPIIIWILIGLSTGMGMYFIYKVIYYLPISLADISYDQRFQIT